MSKTVRRLAHWKKRGFRERDCFAETSSILISRWNLGTLCYMQSQGNLIANPESEGGRTMQPRTAQRKR